MLLIIFIFVSGEYENLFYFNQLVSITICKLVKIIFLVFTCTKNLQFRLNPNAEIACIGKNLPGPWQFYLNLSYLIIFNL